MQQRYARIALFHLAASLAYASEHAARQHATCLDEPRQQSPLSKIITQLRLAAAAATGGSSLVILEKEWMSHKLSTAITRILVREVLGHDIEISNKYTENTNWFHYLSRTQTLPSGLITPLVIIKQLNGLASVVVTIAKDFFASS